MISFVTPLKKSIPRQIQIIVLKKDSDNMLQQLSMTNFAWVYNKQKNDKMMIDNDVAETAAKSINLKNEDDLKSSPNLW